MRIEKVALAICLAILTVGGVWTIAEKLTFSNQNHALSMFQQSCIRNRWSGDRQVRKHVTLIYSCNGMDNMHGYFYVPSSGKTVQNILSFFDESGSPEGCLVVGENWVIALSPDTSAVTIWFDSAIAAKNYASLTGGRVVSSAAHGRGCHVGMY